MTTSSGVEDAPVVMLTRLTALGQHRFGFLVVAHQLSAGAATDGVLGLDFFEGRVLNIDFRAGRVTLS